MLQKIALNFKQKNFFPGLRRFFQKHINLVELRTKSWISQDPYSNDPPELIYETESPYTLGIIKEFWHSHKYFIGACRELKISYKVLDISGPDWHQVIRDSGCDAFLVYPSVHLGYWKQMYDEKLKIIVEYDNKTIFPSLNALWIWESKRRMHYWLDANNIPHPKTWVFYNRKEALSFVDKAILPIVYKSDLGSGASGVKIFRDRDKLKKHVTLCFNRGFTTYRRGPADKEFGVIILQEYIENVREWRMIRIGDSYFGYEKVKIGEYHSGTHERNCTMPPENLLNLTRKITDLGNFLSMDLDIFITHDGNYLINELQPLFGMEDPHVCVVDGEPGRMLLDGNSQSWFFEKGNFFQNNLCNLRVKTLLQILNQKR